MAKARQFILWAAMTQPAVPSINSDAISSGGSEIREPQIISAKGFTLPIFLVTILPVAQHMLAMMTSMKPISVALLSSL
ncbi:hypothetical protein D3C81_2144970 [compost metagenome]